MQFHSAYNCHKVHFRHSLKLFTVKWKSNKTVCHQCQAPYVELTEYKLTERLVLDLVLELALDLVLELALDLVLELALDLVLDLDLDFWNISEAFKPF